MFTEGEQLGMKCLIASRRLIMPKCISERRSVRLAGGKYRLQCICYGEYRLVIIIPIASIPLTYVHLTIIATIHVLSFLVSRLCGYIAFKTATVIGWLILFVWSIILAWNYYKKYTANICFDISCDLHITPRPLTCLTWVILCHQPDSNR